MVFFSRQLEPLQPTNNPDKTPVYRIVLRFFQDVPRSTNCLPYLYSFFPTTNWCVFVYRRKHNWRDPTHNNMPVIYGLKRKKGERRKSHIYITSKPVNIQRPNGFADSFDSMNVAFVYFNIPLRLATFCRFGKTPRVGLYYARHLPRKVKLARRGWKHLSLNW